MNRSIFISRKLTPESLLLAYLIEHGWTIHHRSLIDVEPLPFSIDHSTDWMFISSKNGVRFLAETFRPDENMQIATVGKATATAVEDAWGRVPDFIGESGNSDRVGAEFAKIIGKETVLFAGAENGSDKIRSALPNDQVREVSVYRTTPKKNETIPETEVVYLTSPSNATAFLNSASLEGKQVIAIGNTTGDFLAQQGVRGLHILSEPTEEAVVELLRRM